MCCFTAAVVLILYFSTVAVVLILGCKNTGVDLILCFCMVAVVLILCCKNVAVRFAVVLSASLVTQLR